jgi:hypothetical protein
MTRGMGYYRNISTKLVFLALFCSFWGLEC